MNASSGSHCSRSRVQSFSNHRVQWRLLSINRSTIGDSHTLKLYQSLRRKRIYVRGKLICWGGSFVLPMSRHKSCPFRGWCSWLVVGDALSSTALKSSLRVCRLYRTKCDEFASKGTTPGRGQSFPEGVETITRSSSSIVRKSLLSLERK